MAPAIAELRRRKVIEAALLDYRAGDYVIVPKKKLDALPEAYEETALGTPPALAHEGSFRQYRGPKKTHVYETLVAWIFHRDVADPRQDPIGHVLLDTPELPVAAIAGFGVGALTHRYVKRKRLEEGASNAEAENDAAAWAALAGLLAAGTAFLIVRAIRKSRGRSRRY